MSEHEESELRELIRRFEGMVKNGESPFFDVEEFERISDHYFSSGKINKALKAAEMAISNPLIDDYTLKGAKGLLVNITGGKDLKLFEVDEAVNKVRAEVDPEAELIIGAITDADLDGKMRVSIVATSLDGQQPESKSVINMVHRIQNRNPGYSDFVASNGTASFSFSNTASNPVSHGANALKLENEVIEENQNESVDDVNNPVFPYVLGTKYYGKPETANYIFTPDPVALNFRTYTKGYPNVSTDRQERDSKGFVRPTYEQWPEELIPISPKEGLQITVQTNDSDDLSTVTDSISFRVYYDADGETKYYALPNATKTTVSTAIGKDDIEIAVADVTVLPEPYMNSLGTGYTTPGVVFIGNERVEYFDIDRTNNKLLHCRRGTGTTSAQSHAISTSVFSADVNNILTYETETTWSPDSINGLYASTSEQAIFFKDRPGNALA